MCCESCTTLKKDDHHRYRTNSQKRKMTKKCPVCTKSVYPNDPKISMADCIYHKACAKCATCGGQLTISNFSTAGDRLLCKTHFMEEFHRGGGRYAGDDKYKHGSSGTQRRASSQSSTAAAPATAATAQASASASATSCLVFVAHSPFFASFCTSSFTSAS